MKHDYWPRHLALTAIAALFAMPLAQAQQTTETAPIQLPLGVSVPGSSNTIDMMKGNDGRDARDSTILRNDVLFNEPRGGSNTIDTVEGNDARDTRDSTVLRNDVNVEQPTAATPDGGAVTDSNAGLVREDAWRDTTHGDAGSEGDRFPDQGGTRGAGGGNAGAAGAGAGAGTGGAGGGNGG